MAYSKGETGNPKGQLRAKPVRDALTALLSRPGNDPLADEPKTLAQRLAMDLMVEAIHGKGSARAEARSEIIDRTDGKAIQAVEHSGHIFRTHEEELAALDGTELDDATREGDTPSAEG
jgi:hypothetical protein